MQGTLESDLLEMSGRTSRGFIVPFKKENAFIEVENLNDDCSPINFETASVRVEFWNIALDCVDKKIHDYNETELEKALQKDERVKLQIGILKMK